MEEIGVVLDSYGYLLLFAIGFLEFIGLPTASTFFLVVAGALAAGGAFNFAGVIASIVSGGFLADLCWYGLARTHGERLVGFLCGLAANPSVCVLDVTRRMRDLGGVYLVFGKFVPGASNLVAPAAGLALLPLGIFAAVDVLGLLLWATVYTGIGWVFAEKVEVALSFLREQLPVVLIGAACLFFGTTAWKVTKARRHAAAHRDVRNPGDAVP